MARNGYTNKPCPGCGKENKRRKESVCPECHGFIETGKYHRRLYEKAIIEGEAMEIKTPWSWEKPRYTAFRQGFRNEFFETIGVKMKELVDLLVIDKGFKAAWGYLHYLENRLELEPEESIHEDLPVIFKEIGPNKKFDKYSFNKDSIIERDVCFKLEELHQAINSCLLDLEIQSVEYGKNALFQLNNGDITMDDFNKM